MNRNKKWKYNYITYILYINIFIYNIYVIPITSFKWRSKSKKLIVILLYC